MNTHNRIYQFKISLQGIAPAIWRRIQVAEDYSFWDLHVAIQDAMGWLDYHWHSTLGKLSLITRQSAGKLHFHKKPDSTFAIA